MTDKELAEEYRKSLKQRLIDEDDFERLDMFDENVKEAFLAGLKTSRPQWHDLQKDPNDLPKDKRNVWCDYGYGYGKEFYDKDGDSWWIEGHLYCSTINAWCELPTFNKE